jgi:hypothetical protein
MLVAIAGGIDNIGNGQILIIVDKFLAFGVGKNRPAMVGTVFFSGHWPWYIGLSKAQSIEWQWLLLWHLPPGSYSDPSSYPQSRQSANHRADYSG